MKNIETILSDFGITIPEGKAADLRKAVAENYKTVAEKFRYYCHVRKCKTL